MYFINVLFFIYFVQTKKKLINKILFDKIHLFILIFSIYFTEFLNMKYLLSNQKQCFLFFFDIVTLVVFSLCVAQINRVES